MQDERAKLHEITAKLDALLAKDTTFNDDAKTITEWAKEMGCCYSRASRRVRKALDEGMAERVPRIIERADGSTMTITAFRINL